MSTPILYGLVLAGGKSQRMGIDKGALVYHGKPQREFVYDMLGKFCEAVFLSCKTGDTPPTLPAIYDRLDIDGPLNGIISAMQQHPSAAWLSVPVDMPLINEQHIQYLVNHRDAEKNATCFYDSDGENPEPLFTLWEPRARKALQEYHARGGFSARGFLKTQAIHIMPAPDKDLHVNINTPEDFAQYRKSTL